MKLPKLSLKKNSKLAVRLILIGSLLLTLGLSTFAITFMKSVLDRAFSVPEKAYEQTDEKDVMLNPEFIDKILSSQRLKTEEPVPAASGLYDPFYPKETPEAAPSPEETTPENTGDEE